LGDVILVHQLENSVVI